MSEAFSRMREVLAFSFNFCTKPELFSLISETTFSVAEAKLLVTAKNADTRTKRNLFIGSFF
jgi:hypothetical protein